MGQDRESGRAANDYGHAMAAKVAHFLGTELLSKSSNESVWAGKRIAIKCAHRKTPQIGLSLAMLGRVQNIIAALEDKDSGYTLYQLDPRWYRAAMVPSRSNSPSAQTVMMVSCKEIRTVGQVTGRMPPG